MKRQQCRESDLRSFQRANHFFTTLALFAAVLTWQNTDASELISQNDEADQLASKLLKVPGGLDALASKLHDRADAEQEQAQTDEAASLLFHRASVSHNPRFKRYAANRLRDTAVVTPADPVDDAAGNAGAGETAMELVHQAQQEASKSMAPVRRHKNLHDDRDVASENQPSDATSTAATPKNPNVILKELERQRANRQRQAMKARRATTDSTGFDWANLRKASSGSLDPAMHALERESGKIDNVYDPTEDPDNVGPPASHADKIPSSYWTSDSAKDDWWTHGGEEGMTNMV